MDLIYGLVGSMTTIEFAKRLEGSTEPALRYAIALVFLWIGAMKFTAYEAGAIEGLVTSSPLTSWLPALLGQQGVSSLIGVIEILTGIALAIGNRVPVAGALGASAAIVTCLVTLSFLFSAPGWESSLGGFPALSVVPGQFILKDIVVLAVALHLLHRSLGSL